MNKIIKIGNWWFLEDDVTRFKDHADTVWGKVITNKPMTETIDRWFAGRTQRHAVDIGANIGIMTAYFAQRWQHVTAFEPTPAIFACLEKNCTRDNVDLKSMALSNKTDTVIFAVGKRSEINQIVSSTDILSKH
jgi:16S rRNA A1518/A1519 N6-dimethyltransferase RsmA/KsgA/DIM1 with predicted DNA glycosylase/AP lyase activity